MHRSITYVTLLCLAGGSLAACADNPVYPPADLTAQFAKGGGGTLVYPNANLAWADGLADGTVASIRGDGRSRDGTPSSGGEYEGSLCGVWTRIWNAPKDGDGLLKFDPDTYFDAASADPSLNCGERRSLGMDFGAGTVLVAPEFRVAGIWAVPAGTTADLVVQIGLQGAGPACTLAFDGQYGGSGPARVTRLDGGTGARQWRVESQGSHSAACPTFDRRGKLTGYTLYTLPFSVTVTEVPAA